MALIGLTEAAKLTGKDKATIHRAMKSGRLSFTVSENGERQIDPAELERVFLIKTTDELQRNSSNPKRTYTQPTVKVAELLAQLEAERMKTLGLQERLADKDTVIDDLRQRLDREGEERRRLTAILTDQRAQPIITPPPEIAATPEPRPAGEGTAATNDAPPAPAKRRWRLFGR